MRYAAIYSALVMTLITLLFIWGVALLVQFL